MFRRMPTAKSVDILKIDLALDAFHPTALTSMAMIATCITRCSAIACACRCTTTVAGTAATAHRSFCCSIQHTRNVCQCDETQNWERTLGSLLEELTTRLEFLVLLVIMHNNLMLCL